MLADRGCACEKHPRQQQSQVMPPGKCLQASNWTPVLLIGQVVKTIAHRRAVSPNTISFWDTEGLGRQHITLRRHNSAHITSLPSPDTCAFPIQTRILTPSPFTLKSGLLTICACLGEKTLRLPRILSWVLTPNLFCAFLWAWHLRLQRPQENLTEVF